MRSAYFPHALSAARWAVLLGLLALLAPLSASTAAALASTTGGAAPAAPTGPATPSGSATPGAGRPTTATWFGPGFYGKTTACGQKMSPTLVGVASRTLPCGTLVKVAYRGRLLTVPVIDRGPYGRTGAAWDLTCAAARTLDILQTVRVSTAIVGAAPNGPTLGEPPAASLSCAPPAPPASAAGGTSAG
jgi:rare lipoprotein A (peptidoglycan hydrolase)